MAEKPLKPWKILSSDTVFSDRWIKLRTDRCRTTSGKILESYHIIEFPNWVNVVGFTRELELITLREYRHGAGRVVRGIPAGILEISDRTPEAGARRELEEESGYHRGKFFDVGDALANPATHVNLTHCFLAIDLEADGMISPDPAEEISVEPIPLREILRRQMRGEIVFQSLHNGALHQAIMYALGSTAPELAALKQEIRAALSL